MRCGIPKRLGHSDAVCCRGRRTASTVAGSRTLAGAASPRRAGRGEGGRPVGAGGRNAHRWDAAGAGIGGVMPARGLAAGTDRTVTRPVLQAARAPVESSGEPVGTHGLRGAGPRGGGRDGRLANVETDPEDGRPSDGGHGGRSADAVRRISACGAGASGANRDADPRVARVRAPPSCPAGGRTVRNA